jgi:DNA-binding LacI/PurR family transcriptional regulator
MDGLGQNEPVSIPAGIPAYAFIKREIKNQIESGEITEGDSIPSELELARIYGVSRNPTRQALRDLELEGYVLRMPGRGTFVAPVTQRQRLFSVNGWRTLALACPELESHYTRAVIRGFVQRATEQGFHTMVYFVRFSNEAEFEFLADIRNSGIEGVAFWLQHATERTLGLLEKFKHSSFPFVQIDRHVRGLEADAVVTNNEDVGYQLTMELIRRGHRNIGMATVQLDNTTAQDRFAGYRRALAESQLEFSEELIGMFDSEKNGVEERINRIMANRGRPTAFFCTNDGCALKLIDALTDLGYSVPQHVELATVDDDQLAGALDFPVITASQAGREMGRESANILMARVDNPKRPFEQRFLSAVFDNNTAVYAQHGVKAGKEDGNGRE